MASSTERAPRLRTPRQSRPSCCSATADPASSLRSKCGRSCKSTTFPHDLDPYQAVGVARTTNGGKVTVTIRSDNTAVQSRGRNDPNSFSVAYVGPSNLTSLVFNPNGLASEGGGVTSGQNGVDINNDYFYDHHAGALLCASPARAGLPSPKAPAPALTPAM